MNIPEKIKLTHRDITVPDNPIIPFIEGDGIGVDITPAMRQVVDAAVIKAYGNSRGISWKELPAGQKAKAQTGEYLPEDTTQSLKEHIIGIKGPLATPVGGGYRSLNVALRKILDLYTCVRPIRWYGAAAPVKHPEKLDIVVFRENTEDVYSGVEYQSNSPEAQKIISSLRELGVQEEDVTSNAAVGIKSIGPDRTKRHVRKALNYAAENNRRNVTFMHKGNIMKFTEGAFLQWGYEVVNEPEFEKSFFIAKNQYTNDSTASYTNHIPVNDRIADALFHDLLINSDDFDVIITPNLNGDYLSDAAAAMVGGLGMAPGANIGDGHALFEATHGTAPELAGTDKANPTSLILSAAMLLDYIGWKEAAQLIRKAIKTTLANRTTTEDIAQGWQKEGLKDYTILRCSEYASELINNMS